MGGKVRSWAWNHTHRFYTKKWQFCQRQDIVGQIFSVKQNNMYIEGQEFYLLAWEKHKIFDITDVFLFFSP